MVGCCLIISFSYILFLDFKRPTIPFARTRRTSILLNGFDWDQPLSPFELNSPTDPNSITLLFSFPSPLFPVVLPDQPLNPLVDKFFQSLTGNPFGLTDNPTVPQHESLVNFFWLCCSIPNLILTIFNRTTRNLLLLLQDDDLSIEKL